jgi:hypothetical protein
MHVVLPFKSKQVSGSIEEVLEIIKTPWECPVLQQKRITGESPGIQMSVKKVNNA